MGKLHSELEKKISQLRLEYARVLPNRIELITEKLRRIAAQPENNEMLYDIGLDVHGLVGSSSTYGLIEVSRKARSLETAVGELKGMAEHKRAGSIQGRIWGYLIALKEAVRRETLSEHVRELAIEYALDLSIPSQHVLVGSEEPGTRALLSAYLEHAGHRCVFADSAPAIESLCGQHAIDVALVDSSLYQETGLQNLRAHFCSNASRALICLMSSDDLDALVETAVRSGADGVVAKPISVVRLHASLFAWHRRCLAHAGLMHSSSGIGYREVNNMSSAECPYA